jgi:small subunit ribosomal protein S8
MFTDPIADYLTRIRNAQKAGHKVVEIPSSNIKVAITKILYDNGYIFRYKVEEDDKQGILKIALKYKAGSNVPAIRELKRISRPGLRQFNNVDDLPRVINGLGIAVISTSKGLMTDKQARKENVGGEVICTVY